MTARDFSVTDAFLALVGVSAALTLAESTFRVVNDSWWVNLHGSGYYLVYATPILLAILAIPVFALSAKFESGAVLLSASSATLAVFVVSHFRGSHKWQGFQDLPDRSKLPFLLALATALILGHLVHRRLSLIFARLATLLIIGLSFFWSWIDSLRDLRVMSELAYTRHYVMTALLALLVAVALYDRFGNGALVIE